MLGGAAASGHAVGPDLTGRKWPCSLSRASRACRGRGWVAGLAGEAAGARGSRTWGGRGPPGSVEGQGPEVVCAVGRLLSDWDKAVWDTQGLLSRARSRQA